MLLLLFCILCLLWEWQCNLKIAIKKGMNLKMIECRVNGNYIKNKLGKVEFLHELRGRKEHGKPCLNSINLLNELKFYAYICGLRKWTDNCIRFLVNVRMIKIWTKNPDEIRLIINELWNDFFLLKIIASGSGHRG